MYLGRARSNVISTTMGNPQPWVAPPPSCPPLAAVSPGWMSVAGVRSHGLVHCVCVFPPGVRQIRLPRPYSVVLGREGLLRGGVGEWFAGSSLPSCLLTQYLASTKRGNGVGWQGTAGHRTLVAQAPMVVGASSRRSHQ